MKDKPEIFEDGYGRFWKKVCTGSLGTTVIRVESKSFSDLFDKTIRYWTTTGAEILIPRNEFTREYKSKILDKP